MSTQLYQIVHIFSVILMTAVTFSALASPRPENRRRSMMWSGILAVVALVSGFGMLARLGLAMRGWVIVKLACWLGLTALTSLAYRQPGQGALAHASHGHRGVPRGQHGGDEAVLG